MITIKGLDELDKILSPSFDDEDANASAAGPGPGSSPNKICNIDCIESMKTIIPTTRQIRPNT